jgi:hypothetical protein
MGITPILVGGDAGGGFGAPTIGGSTGAAGLVLVGGADGGAGAAGSSGAAGSAGTAVAGAAGEKASGGSAGISAGEAEDGGQLGPDASTSDSGTPVPQTKPYTPIDWTPTASTTAAGDADLPPNAFDGHLGTRWTTGHNQMGAETFMVDLRKAEPVSRVILDDTTFPTDFPAAYTLEVSTDGHSFTTVEKGHGATVTDIQFATTTARYVRIRQTGTTPAPLGAWWSIDEMKVYP